MAFDIFDLAAKISLDSSELEEGLQKTQGSLSAGAVAMGNLASSAISTALNKTVDFAKSSISAGADFDSAMAQVAATSGVTMDELNNNIVTVGDFTGSLRDFAQQEGATTAFSATQAAEALNYMALAGYDATTSVQMLPNVLNLAAAGGMDLAAASDMVTDAQSALGLSLDQTNVMVDQMAKASSTTNTSVSQLGEAILTVGGTAKSMKGGTEELSAVLGVLADNGIKGAEGGTHLRNMILSLSSPTDDASVALDELGISLYDAQGNMRSLSDVFQDLNKSMEGMTDEQKTNTIATIFNKTDIKAVNALLGTNAERWDEVYGAIDNAAGSAEQMANTQLDNLSGDITIFQSALEGAQIAISDGLSPTLREFVQLGTEGLSQFTEGLKSGGLEGAMDAIGSWLSDALNKVTEMLPSIVEGAAQLVGALGQGIIENLPQLMDTTVQVITTLVQYLIEALPALADAAVQIITELANGIGEALPDLIPAAVQAILTIAQGLVDNLPQLLSAAAALVGGLAQGLINSMPLIAAQVPGMVQQLVSYIQTNLPTMIKGITDFITQSLPQIVKCGLQIIQALGQGLIQAIPIIVEALPQLITAIITFIGEVLPEIIETGVKLFVALIEELPEAIDKIVDALPEIIEAIVGALLDSLPEIIEAGVELFIALVENLPEIIAEIIAAVPDIISAIVEAFEDHFDDLKEAGKYLLEGLAKGLIAGIDGAVKAAKKAAGKIAKSVKDFFGISSPSKLFAQYGMYLDAGLAKGISGNLGMVDDAVDNMAESVSGSFDPSVDISTSRLSGGPIRTVGMDTSNLITPTATRPMTVVLELDKVQFAKMVYQLNNSEAQRVGVSLAGGVE